MAKVDRKRHDALRLGVKPLERGKSKSEATHSLFKCTETIFLKLGADPEITKNWKRDLSRLGVAGPLGRRRELPKPMYHAFKLPTLPRFYSKD